MKTSNPKARTARRFWSILLSLVMVLAMLPTAALADGTAVTGTFYIQVFTDKGGVAIPSPETFTFEITDKVESGTPKPLSDYGITVMDPLEVELTDFENTTSPSTTIRVQVDPEKVREDNGWTKESGPLGSPGYFWKHLTLKQTDGTTPGWAYDPQEMTISIKYYPVSLAGPPEVVINCYTSGDDGTDTASFSNTYTSNIVSFPFTKTVKLGGNTAPGRQAFELEIFDARGVGSADGLYTATVETRGAGDYNGNLIITGPTDEVEALVREDFYVREKNTGVANWTYSKAVWHVRPDQGNDGLTFQIYSTTPMQSVNGIYYVDADTPADRMTFENTYTYNTTSGGYDDDSGATIIVKKTDPAGTPLSGAVFALNNSRGDAVYEATSNSSGVARFTDVSNGTYTLVEQSAPEGYVMSEERYELEVRGSRVTMDGKTYSPVTFVNRRIAELNRKDHFPFLIGYADGTFGPARNMTRAEVTTMFARLLTEQIEADKTYTNTFNDVPSSYWAANYIGYMQQFGIVTGFSDGSFRPNAPVTRAQFAAIASRFEKLTEGTKSFTDVPSTYWAAKYINFAATRGWVTGYADGTFRPANPITRAEVAAVTCRLLERTADQAYVRSHLSQLRTFRDMSESHWAYWYAIEAANGHDYTKAGSGETWSRVHS